MFKLTTALTSGQTKHSQHAMIQRLVNDHSDAVLSDYKC